jgi:hypothetical protein
LAAKRKAIVDGDVEDGASSARRDWRGERLVGIVGMIILVQPSVDAFGEREQAKANTGVLHSVQDDKNRW